VKVAVLTHGSRGDVQPFAALAMALTKAGHEVVLAGPAGSVDRAAPYCARVVRLDDGTNRLVNDRDAWEAVERGFRGWRGLRLGLGFLRRNRALMATVLDDLAVLADALADDAVDLVVHQVNVPGNAIAERLGVPAVPVCLQPFWVPTGSFPDPTFPFPLPRALNRASYLATRLLVRAFTGSTAHWRRARLGLSRRRGQQDVLRRRDGSPATVVQAFSRHLLPGSVSYPDNVRTVGFFFLPAPSDWAPPPALSTFLADGAPPVYLGFGSMVGSDPERTGRVVSEAIGLAGVRAVVAFGRGGVAPVRFGRDVFCLDEAPHDWLFPRMAAIAHHGGAGTTAAGVVAGRPQVVCPFMFDQAFFGRRLHQLGVAPQPLPLRRLTAPDLAESIRTVLCQPGFAARAAELGERVRAEDGVASAVEILESVR
jgi:sterol 3beta-glucosyltransferase